LFDCDFVDVAHAVVRWRIDQITAVAGRLASLGIGVMSSLQTFNLSARAWRVIHCVLILILLILLILQTSALPSGIVPRMLDRIADHRAATAYQCAASQHQRTGTDVI